MQDDASLLYGRELHAYAGPWDSIDENLDKSNALLKYLRGDTEAGFSLSYMGYDNRWNSADQVLISAYGSIDPIVGGKLPANTSTSSCGPTSATSPSRKAANSSRWSIRPGGDPLVDTLSAELGLRLQANYRFR